MAVLLIGFLKSKAFYINKLLKISILSFRDVLILPEKLKYPAPFFYLTQPIVYEEYRS